MKAADLKKGMIIQEGSDLLVVISVDHRTQGNKRGIYQMTMKSLMSDKMLSRRFSPDDFVDKAELEPRMAQYLFQDHAGYHFMDMSTYASIVISRDMVGQAKDYLKENLEVQVLYHGQDPLTIELPVNIPLKIIESAPGIKGDTTGRATKPATLETGLIINVPLFIEEGETVLVDTRTGGYCGRA